MKILLSIILALFFLNISCKSKKQVSSSSRTIESLDGTWVLSRIEGPKKDFSELYPMKLPLIHFDEANLKISGNSGCNSFSGSYGNDKGVLDFTQPLISTKMACKGGGEAVFLQTLNKINGYEIKNDTLILKMASVVMMHMYRK